MIGTIAFRELTDLWVLVFHCNLILGCFAMSGYTLFNLIIHSNPSDRKKGIERPMRSMAEIIDIVLF